MIGIKKRQFAVEQPLVERVECTDELQELKLFVRVDEGWTGNPSYHAALMPCYVRVLEHFELPFRQKESREAIVRYADFSLELLGGNPVDFDKLNETPIG